MKEVKTVKELIEILSKLDPDLVPLTYDDAWGYVPISNIELGKIEIDPESPTKYGCFSGVNDDTFRPATPAVVLGYD